MARTDRDVCGDRIKCILEQFKITQLAFAKSLEVSQSHVSGIISGSKVPSAKLVRAIKHVYSIPDTWWATGEGEIPHAPGEAKGERPEYLAVVGVLEKELGDASPETRYACVTVLNRYIRTKLLDDTMAWWTGPPKSGDYPVNSSIHPEE